MKFDKNYQLTFFLLTFFGLCCNGQDTKKTKDIPLAKSDSISSEHDKDTRPLDQPLKHGIRLVIDSGYVFCDSLGRVSYNLTSKEKYKRNPYRVSNLDSLKKEGGIEGNYQEYHVWGVRDRKEVLRHSLPTNLKKMPSDSILYHAGIIVTAITGTSYDFNYPYYLAISYSLLICDITGNESWVETTVHVYDQTGVLISTIVDNHNIQGTYISSDGRYMLANEFYAQIGDGTSDIPIGLIVYDISKNKLIGKIKNDKNEIYYTDVKYSFYENDHFLLYSLLFTDVLFTQYESIKLIIDPKNKLLYHKIIEKNHDTDLPLYLKSRENPAGEDITTYEVVKF